MDASSDLLKKLFGRPVRVHLALWVLGGGDTFYLQEAQVAMQAYAHAASATREEVLTLRDCGMLVETAVSGRKYYTLTDSEWWQVFQTIGAVVRAQSSALPQESDGRTDNAPSPIG